MSIKIRSLETLGNLPNLNAYPNTQNVIPVILKIRTNMFSSYKYILRVFLFMSGIFSVSTGTFAEQGIFPDSIKLGQSLPLSGPLAESGTEYRDGAQAYFTWINSKGGIHGRRIELISIDDAYVVEKTIVNAKKLLDNDKVFALFGMYGSANYEAALPIIHERNVPSIAPLSGSDDLRAKSSPNTFWLRASYGDEAEKIVDQLTVTGINRIAVLYQSDAFGKAGLSGVEKALKKRNLTLAGSASYNKTTNDVSEAVKSIRGVAPQAVIMLSSYSPTASFIKQMRLSGKQPLFFALSSVGYTMLHAQLGRESAGIAISQVVPYPWNRTTPVVRELESLPKNFQPKAGITYTTLEGFIAAKVMTEALRRAGAKLTREKLVAALEGMRPYDVGGYTVTYGAADRSGSHFVEIAIVNNSGNLMR